MIPLPGRFRGSRWLKRIHSNCATVSLITKSMALAVSPDNQCLFVNSGSRTDHGEVQSTNNRFPDLRETDLTAVILRLPTNSRDLKLPNDRSALKAKGLLFAEGLRNAYDLAFAPNGDLFGGEWS